MGFTDYTVLSEAGRAVDAADVSAEAELATLLPGLRAYRRSA